jgi:hypothetical protein
MTVEWAFHRVRPSIPLSAGATLGTTSAIATILASEGNTQSAAETFAVC